ncbi:hypothetical protein FO519_009095 [Halicephalobus sp. NKZ332]|nr:hypothetical protein FO519_009095 [Halicephalobus sp. NKZ332]
MVTTDGGLIRKRCGPAKSAARRRLAAAREILKDYAEKGLPKDESLKQRMQYELRRIQDGKEKILKIEKDHEELLGTLNEEEVEEELKAWAEIYDGEEGLGELLMNLGDVEIEMELALPLESVPESREGYRMDSDGGKQERRDRSPEVLIVEEEDGRQKERSQEMTAMEKRTGREAVEEPETPRKLRYARLPELTIKPFDGTPTDFIQFWQSFKANIDDQPIAKVTKMEYLKSLLIGKAYKAVEGYIISEENYESCLERLRERFEDNEVITEQLIRQLNEIATIGEGVDERRRVLDEIHSTIRQLENMDHAIDTIQTRNLVLNKFKKSYRLRVMETLENAGKTLSVKNVLQCLEKMVKREEKDEQIYQSNKAYLQAGSRNIRENPIGRNQEFSPGNKQIKGIWTSSKTMERPRSYPPKKVDINNCPFCHQEHRAEECTVMVTPQERAAIIKRSGKCYNCLQEGHQYQKCEEHTCSRCNKKHHIALCLRTEKKVTFEDQRSSVMSSLIDKEKDPKATGLMTARVEVQNPEKQIKFKAVVLMDTGAERSYISNKLAGLLKLKSNVKELVSVEAFGGRNENYESEVVEVEIQTNEGPVKILMNKVRTIINSPVEISQIEGVKKEDKKKDDKKEKIDLLIGGFDVWKFVKNGTEVEPGKVLIESSVGNFVLKKNLKENSITNLAIDGFTKEEQENWNLEIMERNKKKGEDEKALEIFDETTEFINNRYMVRIPWKKENKPLAKNFGLAYGQLKSMVRKLKSNEERLKDYDGIIKQQLRENIIEESPKEEGIFPTYYIPHHAVFKDQRLEWDRTKDQFIVALPKEIPIIQTKRTVLRTLMKIHDPLGWTTPVTVELKAVVNEVVNRHKKWDEPVEKEEERRFNNAMEKIVNKEVEVKRWIHGMKMREKIEVHIFTDATPHIFAAAAYIRVSCENGTLAKLIMAKNRIRKSGTKETIPRMELKAVTLGSRLMDIIEEELGKKIKKRFIWTDSQIVLSWVKKAPQDKVINNRLKELENKEICYGYVESKENPADLPTRGCKPEELKKNNLWWFGPKWLKSEEDLEKRATIKIDNTPRATVISLAGKEQSQAGIELNWEKVGTLRKAETIATWILKAIKKFLRSIKKEPQTKILKEISEGEIEMEDLKIASMWLIKEEQRRWLSEKPPEIGIMEDDIWREEKEDPSYIPAPGREDLIGQLKENLAKLEKFWEIWQGRYLNLLRERTQWLMKQGRGRSKKEPKEGQIVIVFDENRPREFWNLARIEKVIQSGDGEGRAAEIKTQHGTTRRALNHLFALEVDEERMAGEEEKMAGEADSSGLAPNVAASEGPGTKA